MGHLIIHYCKNGSLSSMYQCHTNFIPQHYSHAKIYKNLNLTFHHSLNVMKLCEITDFNELPSSIIIHDIY